MNRQEIFNEIDIERSYQDHKWGAERAPDNPWLAILVEEVGEVAQEICQAYSTPGFGGGLKEELIQVATVAVAWLESLE